MFNCIDQISSLVKLTLVGARITQLVKPVASNRLKFALSGHLHLYLTKVGPKSVLGSLIQRIGGDSGEKLVVWCLCAGRIERL
jgi:hypothetical protein